MSATAPGSLILIGPPAAGCSSVARAIGSAQGLPVLDLGQLVADELGTRPELALVAVAETEYRRIEAGTAERLLERAETGGLVVALVAGAVSVRLMLDAPVWVGALMGVVVGAVGALGDLVESAIKRDAGIKDMSHVVPGHGGAMDRLDSILVAAPLVYAFTLLVK